MIEQSPIRAAGNAMVWKFIQMGGVKIIYMVRLLVLAILLIVIAPILIHDVLDPEWTGTKDVAHVLSLIFMISIIGEVAVAVFQGFGQPKRITLQEVA